MDSTCTFHPCVLKILLPYVELHTCGCYSWSIALVASFLHSQCTLPTNQMAQSWSAF